MSGDVRGELFARMVPDAGPRGDATTTTWRTLDEPGRRRLRRAAADPSLAALVDGPAERAVVAELAARRARWRWTDVLVPVVTGLLVLSTVWGFGRAVFPASAGAWLVAGLLGLAATAVAGLRRAVVRRRAADAVRAVLASG